MEFFPKTVFECEAGPHCLGMALVEHGFPSIEKPLKARQRLFSSLLIPLGKIKQVKLYKNSLKCSMHLLLQFGHFTSYGEARLLLC